MGILKGYKWPGNIRELKNLVDRALSLAESDVIEPVHLPPELRAAACRIDQLSGFPDSSLAEELARCEKGAIARTLTHTKGNMSKASRLLGISRSTLYEKCQRHGINLNA